MQGLYIGEDGLSRCWWCKGDELYFNYHDKEWGRPVTDDRRLFEKICLESFQAGLSWITILRKRENFRKAFDNFDYQQIARYTQKDVERLLSDTGIVRNRQKIEATINNAQQIDSILNQFGSLSNYFWQFQPPKEERPKEFSYEYFRSLAITPTSKKLSKDLKSRGFKFVGPTTMYAFMQAMGLVNDHLEGCYVREIAEKQRIDLLNS